MYRPSFPSFSLSSKTIPRVCLLRGSFLCLSYLQAYLQWPVFFLLEQTLALSLLSFSSNFATTLHFLGRHRSKICVWHLRLSGLSGISEKPLVSTLSAMRKANCRRDWNWFCQASATRSLHEANDDASCFTDWSGPRTATLLQNFSEDEARARPSFKVERIDARHRTTLELAIRF